MLKWLRQNTTSLAPIEEKVTKDDFEFGGPGKEKLVMEVSEIEYADDKMLSREKFLEFILNNIIDLSKRKSIYSRVGFVGTFLKDKYKAIKDRFVNDKKNVDCR